MALFFKNRHAGIILRAIYIDKANKNIDTLLSCNYSFDSFKVLGALLFWF